MSVNRWRNRPGDEYISSSTAWMAIQNRDMTQPPYALDEPRREVVLASIGEVCTARDWLLFAAHVRTNHVHVVVQCNETPEKAMTQMKAWASRRLTEAGLDTAQRKRWTRHGSTRYLWKPEDVEAALDYVLARQGEPMAVFPGPAP